MDSDRAFRPEDAVEHVFTYEMDGQRVLVMRINDRCKTNIITWL